MQFSVTIVETDSMKPSKLIYIAGPTASGKTELAIALAQQFKTVILSCDSRQFYREMTIGTAVPSTEELQLVPHHFIQHLSIHEPYSVGDYTRDALALLSKLFKAHEVVIMVGGSGMYADAVMHGLDTFPAVDPTIRTQLNTLHQQEGIEALQALLQAHDLQHYHRVDKQNPHRLIRALEISLSAGKPYSSFLGKKNSPDFFTPKTVVIDWDRAQLYARINERVDLMVAAGLEDEAQQLFQHKHLNALQTVGYKEWFHYFEEHYNRAKAIEEIKKNTRRYAKRQTTWLRRSTAALRIPGGMATNESLKKITAWI